jgi:hypothetical protein
MLGLTSENAISMFSAYANTFADFAVPVPGTSIGVDLTPGHLSSF